ncbi:MAG: vitamin B12 dependent methionine synthase [Eggerthellaceae bacterium]
MLEGSAIYEHLHAARSCAVMAVTLGLANERVAMRMKARSALDAVVFGAAGSSLVECAADACEAAIVAEAARLGLHTNWRFSPGYGDLPLDIQPAIVRTLEADKKLGMTVTDSNLLVPVKSVTAFVGLFDELYEGAKRSCAGCPCAAHCSLRKAGTPCYR